MHTQKTILQGARRNAARDREKIPITDDNIHQTKGNLHLDQRFATVPTQAITYCMLKMGDNKDERHVA